MLYKNVRLIAWFLVLACGPTAEQTERAGPGLHTKASRRDQPTTVGCTSSSPLSVPPVRGVQVVGGRAILADEPPVVAVVANADGAIDSPRWLCAKRALDRHKVDLVITLGNMGRTTADLKKTFSHLAGPNRLLVALPGGHAPIAIHRRAVHTVAADLPVVDGSQVRFIEAANVLVATLPGVSNPGQAVTEGVCQFRLEDVQSSISALKNWEGLRIWASIVPPRQNSADSSDLASGGVHVGEPSLTAAVEGDAADLVVSGTPAAASPARGGQTQVPGPGIPERRRHRPTPGGWPPAAGPAHPRSGPQKRSSGLRSWRPRSATHHRHEKPNRPQ